MDFGLWTLDPGLFGSRRQAQQSKVAQLRSGLDPHRIQQLAALEVAAGKRIQPKPIANTRARHGVGKFFQRTNHTAKQSDQAAIRIEEGAAVNAQQDILRMPDLTQMQAKVMVNETKIKRVDLGLSANIKLLGQEYEGEVTAVANQSAAGARFGADIKSQQPWRRLPSGLNSACRQEKSPRHWPISSRRSCVAK